MPSTPFDTETTLLKKILTAVEDGTEPRGAAAAAVAGYKSSDPAAPGVWRKIGAVLQAIDDTHYCQEPNVLFEAGAQVLAVAADVPVFKMWYSGGTSGSPEIRYAESLDAITWTHHSAAVITGKTRCNIVKVGATYYLYFPTYRWRHSSTDGVTWDAGVQLTYNGTAGEWEHIAESGWANGDVFVENGTWYLFYEAGVGASGWNTSFMTSPDGVVFTRHGTEPVLPNCSGPCVRKVGDRYYNFLHRSPVFPTVLPTDGYRYSSADLVTWVQDTARPTLPRSSTDEGITDPATSQSGQIADVFLVEALGRCYMFFSSFRNNGVYALGRVKLAIADCTLAELVQTAEGWRDTDEKVNPTLRTNLTVDGRLTVAADTLTANPYARAHINGQVMIGATRALFYDMLQIISNQVRGINISHTGAQGGIILDRVSTAGPGFQQKHAGSHNILEGSLAIAKATAPAATAHCEIGAGTTAKAPLKLTAGTNLTTPVAGSIEFDGTNLYFTTAAGVRKTLAVVP